jgi:hypothetical protein
MADVVAVASRENKETIIVAARKKTDCNRMVYSIQALKIISTELPRMRPLAFRPSIATGLASMLLIQTAIMIVYQHDNGKPHGHM